MLENRAMSIILRSVIIISLLGPVLAKAQEAPIRGSETALEFKVKKELAEERVADFYTRLILLEREDIRREQGAEEMRKERQRKAAEAEKARREYKRPPPVDNEAARKAYERELAEKERRREMERREYVRHRDEVRRWEKSLGSIPENLEYGINPEYN